MKRSDLRPLSCVVLALACASVSCVTALAEPATQPTTLPTTQAWVEADRDPPDSPETIEAAVRRDVLWLADDAREGRSIGSPGLDASADYLARRFADLGLKPLPGLDGYSQPFEHELGRRVTADAHVTVAGERLSADEATIFSWSPTKSFDGVPLAFAGYAIHAPKLGYDDFAGIDVKGKVVLAMRWEPHTAAGKSRLNDGGDGWSREAALVAKAEAAADAGAVGLILVNPPEHHADAEPLLPSSQAGVRRAKIPVVHVTPAAADRLLAKAGAPDLLTLQRSIDAEGKPASRDLGDLRVSADVRTEPSKHTIRNVVAMLPGSTRPDEYVVVGAHYDHVGRGAYGSTATGRQIHNGADDNASGTSAMLALAEQLAKSGEPPERSVIFAGFTAEEVGLIGSAHFAKHPPVPIGQVVGMLNLDMVGRVRNDFLFVGGAGTAAAFDAILAAADADSPLVLKNIGRGGRGPSDHASFSRRSVPVLFLFSGVHRDYHAPGDDADKVNYAGVAQVVGLAHDLTRAMAAMPRQAYVGEFDGAGVNTNVAAGSDPSTMPTMAHGGAGRRPQLGVEPDYEQDDAATPGVRIAGTIKGTAADLAGLRSGDVITKLNEVPIDDLQAMTDFLGQSKVGDTVQITALRDGRPLTLTATLKARGAAQ